MNNRDGTCTVTYLPTVPGDYNVLVRHNEEHITGSPFTVKIAGNLNYFTVNPIGKSKSCVQKRREKKKICLPILSVYDTDLHLIM